MFITKYRDSKGRNRRASPVILARESGSLGDDSPGGGRDEYWDPGFSSRRTNWAS